MSPRSRPAARLVLLLTFLLAASAHAACPATLRFADTGLEGAEELQRAYAEFVGVMQSRLDARIEFFPVGNRTTAINALRFRQVDVVVAGPSEYVLMRERVPGVQPIAAIQRPDYRAVFIVRADSPIRSLADLRGRHVEMKDHGSTTGHILPSLMLREAGLDLDRDLRVTLLGGARMAALASGEVDAVGTGIRDLAPAQAQFGAERFRVIAEGEDAPGDPFVAGAHLPAACVARLQAVFEAEGEAILRAILAPGQQDKYLDARMVEVVDADYEPIRQTYRALGLSRGR